MIIFDNLDERNCRICRQAESPQMPLIIACLCKGTVQSVHKECLMTWIYTSKHLFCEICREHYTFEKTDTPFASALLRLFFDMLEMFKRRSDFLVDILPYIITFFIIFMLIPVFLDVHMVIFLNIDIPKIFVKLILEVFNLKESEFGYICIIISRLFVYTLIGTIAQFFWLIVERIIVATFFLKLQDDPLILLPFLTIEELTRRYDALKSFFRRLAMKENGWLCDFSNSTTTRSLECSFCKKIDCTNEVHLFHSHPRIFYDFFGVSFLSFIKRFFNSLYDRVSGEFDAHVFLMAVIYFSVILVSLTWWFICSMKDFSFFLSLIRALFKRATPFFSLPMQRLSNFIFDELLAHVNSLQHAENFVIGLTIVYAFGIVCELLFSLENEYFYSMAVIRCLLTPLYLIIASPTYVAIIMEDLMKSLNLFESIDVTESRLLKYWVIGILLIPIPCLFKIAECIYFGKYQLSFSHQESILVQIISYLRTLRLHSVVFVLLKFVSFAPFLCFSYAFAIKFSNDALWRFVNLVFRSGQAEELISPMRKLIKDSVFGRFSVFFIIILVFEYGITVFQKFFVSKHLLFPPIRDFLSGFGSDINSVKRESFLALKKYSFDDVTKLGKLQILAEYELQPFMNKFFTPNHILQSRFHFLKIWLSILIPVIELIFIPFQIGQCLFLNYNSGLILKWSFGLVLCRTLTIILNSFLSAFTSIRNTSDDAVTKAKLFTKAIFLLVFCFLVAPIVNVIIIREFCRSFLWSDFKVDVSTFVFLFEYMLQILIISLVSKFFKGSEISFLGLIGKLSDPDIFREFELKPFFLPYFTAASLLTYIPRVLVYFLYLTKLIKYDTMIRLLKGAKISVVRISFAGLFLYLFGKWFMEICKNIKTSFNRPTITVCDLSRRNKENILFNYQISAADEDAYLRSLI